MADEFTDAAALCLAANGIKAYKFESLRPTPELSFAVRELGCIAGINITASHNPPEYNGYKVYWEDGAQFTPPHDKGVTAEVLAIEDLSTVKTTTEEEALKSGNRRSGVPAPEPHRHSQNRSPSSRGGPGYFRFRGVECKRS